MSMLEIVCGVNFRTFNCDVARELGLHEAIIMGELAYEYDYWKNNNKLEDGWFFSTAENIERKTTLSAKQQRKALQHLVDEGWLLSQVRGIPARKWYKLDEHIVTNCIVKTCSVVKAENAQLCEQNVPCNNNNNSNNNSNNQYRGSNEPTSPSEKELKDNPSGKNLKDKPVKHNHVKDILSYLNSTSEISSEELRQALIEYYNLNLKGKCTYDAWLKKVKGLLFDAGGDEGAALQAVQEATIKGWMGFFPKKYIKPMTPAQEIQAKVKSELLTEEEKSQMRVMEPKRRY